MATFYWQYGEIAADPAGEAIATGVYSHVVNGVTETVDFHELYGQGGNDTLMGGPGIDTLNGGGGNDSLIGGDSADVVTGGDGADYMEGGGGNDTLSGPDANDTMLGGTGNDYMSTSPGITATIDGGDDDDTLYLWSGDIRSLSISNVEALDVYYDPYTTPRLQATIEQISALSHIRNTRLPESVYAESAFQDISVIVTGSGLIDFSTRILQSIQVEGDSGLDTIIGGDGSDYLLGGFGADSLVGGLGNDILYSGSSVANEDGASDTLVGGDGNDTLYGTGAGESLLGGAGDDEVHYFSSGNPVIDGGTGTDVLWAYGINISNFAIAEVEILATGDLYARTSLLVGQIALFQTFRGDYNPATGNPPTQAQVILLDSGLADFSTRAPYGIEATASAGGNHIIGADGDDELIGGIGNDTLVGGNGLDTITLGHGGIDSTSGGAGNDSFNVTGGAAHTGSSIDGGADTDTVHASNDGLVGLSMTNVERLHVSAGPLALTVAQASMFSQISSSQITTRFRILDGGAIDFSTRLLSHLNAHVQGSDNGNAITTGIGNDTLLGGTGSDTFTGGTGNDSLDGGGGTDTASYIGTAAVTVSLATTTQQNTVGAGLDTLTGIENLVGSSAGDRLTGDGGRNVINGANGNDTLNGGFGNDRLLGGSGNDSLVGGQGNDTLEGSTGNDTLAGWQGNDRLAGGAGLDSFLFNTALGTTNIDTIVDYVVADDTILLENAVFTAFGAFTGTLWVQGFHTGTAAHDASDRIIYDSASGALYYDPDGTGAQAQVQFATLTTGLALTSADIRIV